MYKEHHINMFAKTKGKQGFQNIFKCMYLFARYRRLMVVRVEDGDNEHDCYGFEYIHTTTNNNRSSERYVCKTRRKMNARGYIIKHKELNYE